MSQGFCVCVVFFCTILGPAANFLFYILEHMPKAMATPAASASLNRFTRREPRTKQNVAQ